MPHCPEDGRKEARLAWGECDLHLCDLEQFIQPHPCISVFSDEKMKTIIRMLEGPSDFIFLNFIGV